VWAAGRRNCRGTFLPEAAATAASEREAMARAEEFVGQALAAARAYAREDVLRN
jgi:hypothetical protein